MLLLVGVVTGFIVTFTAVWLKVTLVLIAVVFALVSVAMTVIALAPAARLVSWADQKLLAGDMAEVVTGPIEALVEAMT